MPLQLIVAMDKNRAIGNKNALPWPRLKKDMKYFRRQTKGHAVIMGRKTYESIGKPLKNRKNIVISRRYADPLYFHADNPPPANLYLTQSPEEALEIAHKLDSDPFVIGGSEIYRQMLPKVGMMHITEVQDSFEGDAYFPDYDLTSWNEIDRKVEEEIVEGRSIKLVFRKLER